MIRDHAKSECTPMQLGLLGTLTKTKHTHNTDDESNSYRVFHGGKICDLINLANHQHLLTSLTSKHTPGVDYTKEHRLGSVGPRPSNAFTATSEARKQYE